MSQVPQISVNFDELERIARILDAESQRQNDLYRRLRAVMENLRDGWEGKGASKFFDEMEDIVLPRQKNLESALGDSHETLHKIMSVMTEAEDVATSIFHGPLHS